MALPWIGVGSDMFMRANAVFVAAANPISAKPGAGRSRRCSAEGLRIAGRFPFDAVSVLWVLKQAEQ